MRNPVDAGEGFQHVLFVLRKAKAYRFVSVRRHVSRMHANVLHSNQQFLEHLPIDPQTREFVGVQAASIFLEADMETFSRATRLSGHDQTDRSVRAGVRVAGVRRLD